MCVQFCLQRLQVLARFVWNKDSGGGKSMDRDFGSAESGAGTTHHRCNYASECGHEENFVRSVLFIARFGRKRCLPSEKAFPHGGPRLRNK